jgi:hypothetical protein
MTFSNDMLQTARAAAVALRDQAPRVLRFLETQRHPGGGFLNRAGEPDLYYTVFGIDSLLALGADPSGPSQADYLRSFGTGETLDFIHLTCLARCWARLPDPGIGRHEKNAWRLHLEQYRSLDGGFSTLIPAATTSVSASFLALQALEDLNLLPANPLRALSAITALRTRDGAYGNEPGLAGGTTLATAGVVCLHHRLHLPAAPALVDWLLARCHPEGGFLANPTAPVPDLLSTATVLYALHRLRHPLDPALRNACLRFIESVMDESGGFCGHGMDDTPDCEYTFYALLALGCLAEGSVAR